MNSFEKEKQLRRILDDAGSIAVAYSGGVDSTYLLKIASEELGSRVLAITAVSPTFSQREREKATELAENLGVNQVVFETDEMSNPNFKSNPPNRCYYCKHELFNRIREIAGEQGIEYIADGSNADDVDDYRPGMVALEELGIKSPLKVVGFSKKEIRERSKELDLPTWSLPSIACLASRFPYGTPITSPALRMIEDAENKLIDLGFRIVRVRYHGDVARIEIGEDEISRLIDSTLRRKISDKVKAAGFKYVSFDIDGYRTGSLNEVLDQAKPTSL
jgi:uncharacterized protein